MARTSSRRWKGCPMCKDHKHAGHGDTVRQPRSVWKKLGLSRRARRNSLGDQEY